MASTSMVVYNVKLGRSSSSSLDERNLLLPWATSDKHHKPTSFRRARVLFKRPHAIQLIVDMRVRLAQLGAHRGSERRKGALGAEFLENSNEWVERDGRK